MWLQRKASSDIVRIERNIERLEELRKHVHELGYVVFAANSAGYMQLKKLVDDKLVLGRPLIHAKLKEALIGENNQKIALDSPSRFQGIMQEAERLIEIEITKERRELAAIGPKDE